LPQYFGKRKESFKEKRSEGGEKFENSFRGEKKKSSEQGRTGGKKRVEGKRCKGKRMTKKG